jgi:hypothetical protein
MAGFDLWRLTPLSTIFQLYRSGQGFFWWWIHTCQVTRFRLVTPGNSACHPHFPEHPSRHGFHYDYPESPGIGPYIRNIYLFGKYRDFTYGKLNNPNGQLQSTTPIYLRGK